jgi:adenine deaminase
MAVASTVAHDSHHMIVVGTIAADMAAAANRLAEVGGGVTVWKDEAEIALVELPIAGLMSDARPPRSPQRRSAWSRRWPNAAAAQQRLHAAFAAGARGDPRARISDLGLVDVTRFALTPLFEETP